MPLFAPLWRIVKGFSAADRFARSGAAALRDRGFSATADAFGTLAVAGSVAAFCLASVVTLSLFGGAAVALCGLALLSAWARSRADKRRDREREAVPDILQSMKACFQSGLSLMQTLEQVGSESHGSVGKLFARASHTLRTGGTTAQALRRLRDNGAIPELAFVSVALDVQHQAGGSMSHVLDAAHDMVKNELSIARSLRVHTAQARLSAQIVGVMPFLLVAVFSLISPGFLAPFFESFAGVALLAVAVLMQAAGIMLVRRTLKAGEAA